jgi:serine/threonine-protein kinase
MVTGQLPFKGDSNYSLMAAHLKEIPKPPIVLQPGIPDSLNQIILMALAKEPEKRFQSADAFRAALKSVDARALLGSSVTEYTIPPAGLPPASTVRRIAPASPASAAPPANAPNVLEPAHAAAAVAPNVAPPPSAAAGYRRGLYIALGAFLVVAVLAAAGFYLPRRAKTQADAEKPAAASPAPVSQPSTPSVSPAPTSQPESSPAEPVADPPKPQPPSPPVSDAEKLNHARQAQAQAEAETQARAAAAAALEEAENHHDQLNARASAVAQSLENLRNRQGAQGYGLRGDVVAAQQRMDSNLAKAQAALQSQDTAKARKYLEAAERDLEFLEKFLGR